VKKIAVGNMGEEELAQLVQTRLTRDDTRAEADLLFGGPAKDMRKADRGLLEKLFVQTPASVTNAPNLQKEASMSKVGLLKLAMGLSCGPDGSDTWLTQFEGTSLMPQAIALEEQTLQMEQEDIQNRIEEQHRYSQQDQERNARYQKSDQIRLQKRVLALELAKQQAGVGAPEEEEMPPEAMEHEQALPPEAAPPQAPPQAPPGEQKTASITPRVDAFFEKLSAPTDAQRRYPELMKVSAAGTVKSPNIKPRVTTETSGTTPTRSALAGGSA